MTARLRRLVLALAALGAAGQAAALLAVGGAGPVASVQPQLPWARGPLLLALLLALTVVGDLVSVRVRRGEQTEELTLFEAAVVIDVLLLPATEALVVPVLASLLCSAVRRRAPVKAVFNAGNLACAAAAFVGLVHLLTPAGSGLTARTVGALLAGTLVFTGINLVALARVYALLGDEPAWDIVRDGARLSGVMAVGMVAIGGTAVTVSSAAPALLPFTVIPALALTLAYRATAQEAEERQRSTQLLALSQVLAGRLDADEVLGAFLTLAGKAFAADTALAVLYGDGGPQTVAVDGDGAATRRPSTSPELALLARAQREGVLALSADLPAGWARAVLAPLEAEGRHLGAVVLASRDRRAHLGRRELTVLTPLASSLAVALRNAEHLRRLTEQTSKLTAVVAQSSDGILVLDGDGIVQLWGPALTLLTGRDEGAALGRPWRDLVVATGADGAPADAFAAGAGLLSPASPQAVVELTLTRPDGQERVVRCAHAGAFDQATGALVRDVVIVHDVTRERQVERLKADFIATVSHELRTPITPIKGYADLLRRRSDAMTPQKRAECLEIISSRTEHLSRLVEDLLLASRMSATDGTSGAQVELGEADLVALVRRACGDFGEDGDRIVLELPPAAPVTCDPMRTVQVLTNLVGNALKYSTSPSPVHVRLTTAAGTVTVQVHDRGRGIPADQLERVFDKFHRVEDPMRMTTGGTGLGLYIARELATAMGGSVTCRSALGEGSVFALTLPAAPVDTAPVPSPRGGPPDWAGRLAARAGQAAARGEGRAAG